MLIQPDFIFIDSCILLDHTNKISIVPKARRWNHIAVRIIKLYQYQHQPITNITFIVLLFFFNVSSTGMVLDENALHNTIQQ